MQDPQRADGRISEQENTYQIRAFRFNAVVLVMVGREDHEEHSKLSF